MKDFSNISINVLKKHALQKKKFARGNQMPFITKDLSKEKMKRSSLTNKSFKNEKQNGNTKQKNYWVSLSRKAKIRYYANLNDKKVLDNKQFWKVVKPLFSDKSIK